jgi:hypothetical protein
LLEDIVRGAALYDDALADTLGRPWFIAYTFDSQRSPGVLAAFDSGSWLTWSSEVVGCQMLDGLTEGPESTIWVYGYPGCVAYLGAAGEWHQVASGHSLPGPAILWAEFAPDGTLWVGGYRTYENPRGGGWVASWDGAQWRQASAVPNGFPQDVAFDHQGGVWVAFDPHGEELAGGLAYHDRSDPGDRWTVVEGLPSHRVGRLLIDDGDGLWIAYVNDPFAPIDERDRSAVSYLEDGRWTHWTDQDGLPGGDPTDRCLSLTPCRLRNDIQRQGIFQTADGSIVVEMEHICTTGKGSTCVGGGWAEYDGANWTRVGRPEFGIRTDTENVWKPTSYGGLEPTDATTALATEVLRFETNATAPTTTTTMPPTTTSSTTSAPTTTTTVPPTTTTLAPIDALESGLFCRDLAAAGFSYGDAVTYWVSEGSPDRMDADRNGIPCETIYSADDVIALWGDPLPIVTTLTADAYHTVAAHTDSSLWPVELPGSGEALGSGCSPGGGTLPDGIWAGWITVRSAASVEFDLACAYAGGEGGPGISNVSTRLRTVTVAGSAVVYPISEQGLTGEPVPYSVWQTAPVSRFCEAVLITPAFPTGCPVWLYVNDGRITEIVEFWTA